ncbi:hypothetical protein QTP88_027622 [Uroleucon formosanum]
MQTSENSIIPITPRRGRKKIALPSEWQRQRYSSIGFPSRPQCKHKNKNQQQYQCRTLTMQDVRRAHQMFYEIPDKIKQDEKGLCKRGKTITSMKPNVINKGVQVNAAKKTDVDNLLKKNFGCNWKNLPDLEYFKTVMDDEENNEQDHESDFEDINEEEEFS